MPTLRALVLVLLLALAPPLVPASEAPAGCVGADVALAAQALVHEGARVARSDEVAGFATAVVLAPIVHPGVRIALVEAAPGVWCRGDEGFLAAWRLAGRGVDAPAQADAFVRLASAPWMDGVSVLSSSVREDGTLVLRTHARSMGTVAQWLVQSDAAGIRRATFTAEAFLVPPLDGTLEGLTALPGLARTFERQHDGRLALSGPLLGSADPPRATTNVQYTASDGFHIRVVRPSTGQGGVGLSLDREVGARPVDLLLQTRDDAAANYEEFLAWGLKKGWFGDTGMIHLDGQNGFSCLACVFVSETFNIHMSSMVVEALCVLQGYCYGDARAAFSDILGHEMTHNFQNAYYKPQTQGFGMGGAFIEGFARFQETIHVYSEVGHQPDSLVYAADGNGCNFRTRSAASQVTAFREGPSINQSYAACGFWLPWYGVHGPAGVRALFENARAAAPLSGWREFKTHVEAATGAQIDDDLAAYARTWLTRDGLVWGPATGSGPVLDWGAHLRPWVPPGFNASGPATERLRDGGMMAREIKAAGVATVEPAMATALYVVRDDGATSAFHRIASGTHVAAPGAGEKVWLVAIHPDVGEAVTTLSFT